MEEAKSSPKRNTLGGNIDIMKRYISFKTFRYEVITFKKNENSMLNPLKLFTDKGKFYLEVLNLIRWDF